MRILPLTPIVYILRGSILKISVEVKKKKPLIKMQTGAWSGDGVYALRNFIVYQTRKDVSFRCLQIFYTFIFFCLLHDSFSPRYLNKVISAPTAYGAGGTNIVSTGVHMGSSQFLPAFFANLSLS